MLAHIRLGWEWQSHKITIKILYCSLHRKQGLYNLVPKKLIFPSFCICCFWLLPKKLDLTSVSELGFAKIFYRLHTNFSQTSYKCLKNFLQTSNKLLTNFLQPSYKLLTTFLQTSYKLLTNFLQTCYKLVTNFSQTSYELLVNFSTLGNSWELLGTS